MKRGITRLDYVDGWFNQRRKNQEAEAALKDVERRVEKHVDFYNLFQLEMKVADVNPFVYVGKLVLGVVCFAASILLWIQMYRCDSMII